MTSIFVCLSLPLSFCLSLSCRHPCTLDIVLGLTHCLSDLNLGETTSYVMRPPYEETHTARDRGLLTTT